MTETNRSDSPDLERLFKDVNANISQINSILLEINNKCHGLGSDLQNLVLPGITREIQLIACDVRRLARLSSRIDPPSTTIARAREMIRWENEHGGKSHE